MNRRKRTILEVKEEPGGQSKHSVLIVISNPRQEVRLFKKPDTYFIYGAGVNRIGQWKTNRWAEFITGEPHARRFWDDEDFAGLVGKSFYDEGRYLCECGRFFDEPFGASDHGIWKDHCPHCGGRRYDDAPADEVPA